MRCLLIIFLLLWSSPAFAGDIPRLEPYSASYSVKYRGFTAGLVHFALIPKENNTYLYLSRVEPGTLASLVVSPEAFERTIVKVDEQGVRPLSWKSEDGTSDSEDDGELTFDWQAQRVFGTVEDEAVDVALEPDLQNRLSMQIEVLSVLQRDMEPESVKLIDGDKIKLYSYQRKDEQRIDTAAGSYDTIVYESSREGSKRMKRIYHAPELDYIPVRIEHYRKDSLETVMELVAYELNGEASMASQQSR